MSSKAASVHHQHPPRHPPGFKKKLPPRGDPAVRRPKQIGSLVARFARKLSLADKDRTITADEFNKLSTVLPSAYLRNIITDQKVKAMTREEIAAFVMESLRNYNHSKH